MMLRLAALRTSTKLSFHGIAAALNAEFNADLTTNACIGMAHRIGLPRHDGKVRKMRTASKPKRIKVRVDAPIAPRLSVRSLEPTPLLIELATSMANIGLLTVTAQELVRVAQELTSNGTPTTSAIDKLEQSYVAGSRKAETHAQD